MKICIIRKMMISLSLFLIILGIQSSNVLCDNRIHAAEYGISNPRIAEDGTVTWDKIVFGKYMQSTDGGMLPIEWRVLEVNGDDAYIVSDNGLDYIDEEMYRQVNSDYDSDDGIVGIRTWLNKYFLKIAFDQNEQTAINNIMESDDDISFDKNKTIYDKIMLLSKADLINPKYGFKMNPLTKDNARCLQVTDYVKRNDSLLSKGNRYQGNCTWSAYYNRTNELYKTTFVSYMGAVYDDIPDIECEIIYHFVMRPALHINLAVPVWKAVGTVTLSDELNNIKNTKESLKADSHVINREKLSMNSVKCKRNSKIISGKVSKTGCRVKVKIGKMPYKKAKVKGKSFTLKCPSKLEKKAKIGIIVTRNNCIKAHKQYIVK